MENGAEYVINTPGRLFFTDMNPFDVYDALRGDKTIADYEKALGKVGENLKIVYESMGPILLENNYFSFYTFVNGIRLQIHICKLNGVGGNHEKAES
jgi:hypothetical protein